MNSFFRNSLLITVVIVCFASCGSHQKLLKSNDTELLYQTALQYYQEKKNEKAIALFEMIDYSYMGTAREDTVKFYTAMSHFRRGDYYTANELFQDFRRRFGRSPFIEETDYLIAMGYYMLSPDPELDQTPTKMALLTFNDYLSRYPNSIKYSEILELIEELQQKLYDKSFLNAKLYYNIGQYKSAIHSFKLALAEYPETTHREEILFLLTKSTFVLADNSFEELQRRRYLDVLDSYYNLISEFPETKHLKELTPMYEKAQSTVKEHDTTAAPTTENKE